MPPIYIYTRMYVIFCDPILLISVICAQFIKQETEYSCHIQDLCRYCYNICRDKNNILRGKLIFYFQGVEPSSLSSS